MRRGGRIRGRRSARRAGCRRERRGLRAGGGRPRPGRRRAGPRRGGSRRGRGASGCRGDRYSYLSPFSRRRKGGGKGTVTSNCPRAGTAGGPSKAGTPTHAPSTARRDRLCLPATMLEAPSSWSIILTTKVRVKGELVWTVQAQLRVRRRRWARF